MTYEEVKAKTEACLKEMEDELFEVIDDIVWRGKTSGKPYEGLLKALEAKSFKSLPKKRMGKRWGRTHTHTTVIRQGGQ